MENIFKEFTTWAEAERWMARHGYGLEQIRIAKELWETNAATTSEKPLAKPAPKTVSKPVNSNKVS